MVKTVARNTYPTVKRVGQNNKTNVNIHFAMKVDKQKKVLYIDAETAITTRVLKLNGVRQKNMIAVNYDRLCCQKITKQFPSLTVIHNSFECVIEQKDERYGAVFFDGTATIRTQYDTVLNLFKYDRLHNNSFVGITYSLRGCGFVETDEHFDRLKEDVEAFGYRLIDDEIKQDNGPGRGNQVYTRFFVVEQI